MKLLTIVCEALAREPVARLLSKAGAQGYTLFKVEGLGSHGPRTDEMTEMANIQVEVIVPELVSVQLMEQLERDFFPKYAMIVYETDVSVRRPGKF